MKNILITGSLCFIFATGTGQNNKLLIPEPQHVQFSDSKLRLGTNFSIQISDEAPEFFYERADAFLRRMAGRTGLFIKQGRINSHMDIPADASLSILINRDSELKLGLDESYEIRIEADHATLLADNPYGALYGMETLLQLISADHDGYYLPACMVKDAPRFAWRGLLLDPARHWLPVEVIKRNIDGMLAVKMNVLHLHLTEDQGFRIESKQFPKLHQMGGEGMYYTQTQMKELIQYAAERGIRVVPEFDIPGHATSWLVGYPELATLPGPYSIEREWGVMDPVLDPTKDYTYEFLDIFLSEMANLFPDAYMHIGGDENNGKHWKQASHIQQFMNENNITDHHQLQAYFNLKVLGILQKNGKTMVGWDEIQHPGIPKNVVIQSWRGQKGLEAAAKAGYQVMLSNGYYIDLIQPASFHYMNDPLPNNNTLSAEERKLILGGEATMWGEQVVPETIDSRIWPRTGAIAERLWSAQSVDNVQIMYKKLEKLSLELEELGLQHERNYEMMLRRLTGGSGADQLKVLVDVLEPVKIYKRNALSTVNALMPYTRTVDAARPDAMVARKFNEKVESFCQTPNVEIGNQLLSILDTWFRSHQQLKPIIDKNPVLKEIEPLSKHLSAISFLGQQAIAYILAGEPAPEKWVEFGLEVCSIAAQPHGETELMIVKGIQALINKSA